MNREIKFRIWNPETKNMLYNVLLGGWSDLQSARDAMQYTGLKDKNGKEIYEGDKIKLEGINGKFWNVVYDTDRWGLKNTREYYENGDYYRGDDIDWKECEVIGNIYENNL